MDEIKKYLLLLSFFAFSVTLISCDGEILILNQPEHLRFYDDRPLYSSELKYVFGTCMGYLADTSKEWQDIHIGHPMDYSKIALIIADVPGIRSLNLTANLTIPLMEDEPLEETFKELDMKTTTVFTEYKLRPKTKRIELAQLEHNANEILTSPLVQSTVKLLDLVQHEYKKEKKYNGATLFWGVYPEFNETEQEYYDTARLVVQNTLASFFEAPHDGYYPLVVMITHDNKISLTRRKRQVKTEEVPLPTAEYPTVESLNLADDYDENFPVIFNIMLWFSVALLFSLIAICLVIASMDPGRDSIIYRMTSTRMKKDS